MHRTQRHLPTSIGFAREHLPEHDRSETRAARLTRTRLKQMNRALTGSI
jgi:hypothetical protein